MPWLRRPRILVAEPMKRTACTAALSLLVATTPLLHAADPVVANVVSAQRAGTKLVDITFDVSDADSD